MRIKKYLAFLLVLALALCLLPTAALADPEETPGESGETQEPAETDPPAVEPAEPEEPAPSQEPETPAEPEPPAAAPAEDEEDEEEEDGPVIVAEEESAYAMPGQTVYNNGGTVYNNGALVYNNGGLVYLNDGVVYNNGGVVYANGGTVYNNGGVVYRNEALVYTFGEDEVLESHIYGYYTVTMAEDYSALADFEGLENDLYLTEDSVCTITPHEGLLLVSAEADAGVLTENEDGSWTLEQVDADLTLTLSFRTVAPAFDLEEGTYAEEKTLTITVPAFSAGREGEDPPKAAPFSVENSGAVDAKIESVELQGEHADCFKLNTGRGSTVKAGKTNSSSWTVRPVSGLEKGLYTVEVVFTLSGGETVTLEISYNVK